MSFVSVVPDIVSAAAGNLADIGSAMTAANAAAATPTTGLVAMASDEVSAAITAVFSSHAQAYQNLGAQAAAFHDQFVRTLSGGAGAYVATEIANAQQSLLNAVNAPAAALLGQPLLGAVANAAESQTQSYNFPLGPLQLSATFTGTNLPDGSVFASGYASATLTTPVGPYALLAASGSATAIQNGPVSLAVNGTSPYGPVSFGLNGVTVSGGSNPVIQFTSGSLGLPPAIPLLAAEFGPAVVGGATLLNSGNTFVSALASGNIFGAADALVTSPLDYSNAVLFGHTTVTVPDQSWLAPLGLAVSPELHIPFGGLLASTGPATLSFPTVTYSGGTLLGSEVALQGTQFGGLIPVMLNSAGI
ncbi:MAG: PE family protein [Mycobacterium sp.]